MRMRSVPRPANFFTAPDRSGLHPVLIAAMVLAWDWCEEHGLEGFLTREQLYAAAPQISAHGIEIDTVIQDLLSAGQLTPATMAGIAGFQLPFLHAYAKRRSHAASEKQRYHEHGCKQRKKSRAYAGKPPTVRRGAPDRRPAEAAPPTPEQDFTQAEPVSGVHVRAAGAQTHSTAGNYTYNSDAAQTVHRDAVSSVRKAGADPVPIPDLSSLHSYLDSEGSTLPVPSGGSGTVWSHPPVDTQAAEGGPTPQSEPAPSSEGRPVLGNPSRAHTMGLSPESADALEEVLTKLDHPEVYLDDEGRRAVVARAAYHPHYRLLAKWIDRLPIEQIYKDFDRYLRKGNCDSTAISVHDHHFEEFMLSTLRYKFQKMTDRLNLQRAMRRTAIQNRSASGYKKGFYGSEECLELWRQPVSPNAPRRPGMAEPNIGWINPAGEAIITKLRAERDAKKKEAATHAA